MFYERYLTKQLHHFPSTVTSALPDWRALVAVAQVQRVVLLSTGVIDQGEPFLSQLYATQDQTFASKQRILQVAASLASNGRGSLFAAIVHAAREAALPCREAEVEVQNEQGVVACLDRTWYLCGDERLMQAYGIEPGISLQTIGQQLEAAGMSLLYLAQRQPKRLLGMFACDRTVSTEQAATVTNLTELGIEVLLLSELKTSTVKGLAQRIGITLIHSELLPVEKRMVAGSLQDSQRPTLFLTVPESIGTVPPGALTCCVGEEHEEGVPYIRYFTDLPVLVSNCRASVARAKRRYFWCTIR